MITVCVRFDCVKYSGEHEAGDESDDDDDNRVTYSLGIAMLVFRIRSPAFGTGEGEGFRDFCFVRQMKPAERKKAGNFPKHACERSHLYDIKPTNHKLGRLWTWDRWDRRQVYKVLAVKDVHETRAIMPYWQKDTAKWSIGTGVYENKFLMDDRTRPPFITRCLCLGPAP